MAIITMFIISFIIERNRVLAQTFMRKLTCFFYLSILQAFLSCVRQRVKLPKNGWLFEHIRIKKNVRFVCTHTKTFLATNIATINSCYSNTITKILSVDLNYYIHCNCNYGTQLNENK